MKKHWLKQWIPGQSKEDISPKQAPEEDRPLPSPPVEESDAPTREELLAHYLNFLENRHSHLKLKGLLHGHIPRVNVKDIYIALKAVAGEGYQEERRLLLDKMERLTEETRHEEERTSSPFLETGFYRYDEQTQHKLEVESLFEKYPRLVIVGEPGSGKTTLLEHLILQLINKSRQASAGPDSAGDPRPIPLFFSLRDLKVNALPTPDEFSKSCVPEELMGKLPADFFQDYLQAGSCVLFFDGLDEITAAEERQLVSQWIDDLCRALPENNYVATSRIIGYREAPLHEGFHKYRLCDFDSGDVREFVYRWQSSLDPGEKTGGAEFRHLRISGSVDRLLEIMRDNAGIRRLASNPLLLTIILLVYNSRARLPEERGRLYEECVNVLLEHLQKSRLEDSRHGAYKATQGIKLEQQRDLLKSTAFWLHERGAREEEQEILCRDILRPQFPAIGLESEEAEPFLREVEERSGLLVHRGSGIGFSHLTFQEYLAALELGDREDPRQAVEFLVERRFHSWWREVIYLYAASVQNASGLIRRLMEEEDTEMRHILLLAGNCLADARKVTDLNLRKKIIRDLAALYQTTPFSWLRFQARQVLVRIGTEEVVALFREILERKADNLTAVRDAVEVISRLRVGTDVLRPLLEVLKREDLPERVRRTALRSLRNVDKCNEELEALLLSYLSGEAPLSTRKEALLTLGRLSPSPRIIEWVSENILRNTRRLDCLDDLFVSAAKGFIKYLPGEEALELLKVAMTIPDSAEYKVELCRAITFIKAPEEEIRKLLMGLLQDGMDWGARGGAALALGLLKNNRPDIARSLMKRLFLERESIGVRLRIAEALRGFGWHDPEFLRQLSECLEWEPHKSTRWKLTAAYAQLTRDDEFIRDKLIGTLVEKREDDEEDRIQALTILRQVEYYQDETTAHIIERLREYTGEEAKAALHYLTEAPGIPESGRGALGDYLRQTMHDDRLDGVLRDGAFETLYGFYDLFLGATVRAPYSPAPPKFPLGVSDFEEIIEEGYFYVDKSLFIKELIEEGAKALLIPRPRRFGKTLNMHMLKTFYEKSEKNKRRLFDNLAISRHPECMKHQGQYPVVFLTFKGVKQNTWENCFKAIKNVIGEEYARHGVVLKKISPEDRAKYEKILSGEADSVDYEDSLRKLIEHLKTYYGERVMVLIDEYDMPMEAAFNEGYLDEAVSFFRNLLSGGLKDNKSLEKGILTGILRIAKESIFSGLNNMVVFSIMRDRFGDKFGLTEEEVEKALGDFELSDSLPAVRKWYDGYGFGSFRMYNPWSLINFLGNREVEPYWTNATDNTLIQHLLLQGDVSIKEDVAALLNRETISVSLDENIVFPEISRKRDAIWNFLAFTGYLAIKSSVATEEGKRYELGIPNQEVRKAFTDAFSDWLNPCGVQSSLKEIHGALREGNTERFGASLQELVERVMSYHDPAGKDPEGIYHCFVLGMLVNFENYYRIDSNRESGFGRYDIMMIPRDPSEKGIVLEFKRITGKENVESILEQAVNQMQNKDYAQRLREEKVQDILGIAVVFQGKRVWVKGESLSWP